MRYPTREYQNDSSSLRSADQLTASDQRPRPDGLMSRARASGLYFVIQYWYDAPHGADRDE
jgi:hypothetical protein